MRAEHRRPLYAFCVLALASSMMIGQGLRAQAILDYFVGDRGHGSVEVAAGSTISAATGSGNTARGTTVVAVPERRTVAYRPAPVVRATRPAPAAQPATLAPGRSHQAAGKAHASGSRGKAGQAARNGRDARNGSERALHSDVHAAKGQAKASAQGKSKAKKAKKAKRRTSSRHHGR